MRNILVLLVLVGCGSPPKNKEPFPPPIIDMVFEADLENSLTRFRTDYEKYTGQVFETEYTIYTNFGRDYEMAKASNIGECYFDIGDGERAILISVDAVNSIANSVTREYALKVLYVVLVHEAGHCAFNLPHDNTEPNIMNSSLSAEIIKERYIEQFFNELDEGMETLDYLHIGCKHEGRQNEPRR